MIDISEGRLLFKAYKKQKQRLETIIIVLQNTLLAEDFNMLQV